MRQLLLFALSFVLISNGCKKKKDDEPQLPPETTTGANTFGCKVNGKVFIPRSGGGRPGLFAQYVNLGTGTGGGWFLNIAATDWKASILQGTSITTDSLLILENSTYLLKAQKGSAKASYENYPNGLNAYEMLSNNAGELIITRHNLNQRILSGRFWFDATNASGQKVEVREGRFDIIY